jgi:hypothetical protein
MIGDTVPTPDAPDVARPATGKPDVADVAVEHGGRPGPDPTRYGDWEKNGRCIDF